MFKKTVSVCMFLTIIGFTTANVKTCYQCNSKLSNDCDPLNSEKLKPIECDSLIYSRSGHDVFSIVAYAQNHERLDDSYKYVCLKYSAKLGVPGIVDVDTGITRTCLKIANNIEDPCEFLQKESASNSTYVLSTCNYCTTDNCNSGILHKASGILMGIILFLASL